MHAAVFSPVLVRLPSRWCCAQWDTPATLGCEEELVSITNSTVLFGVTCKEKKKKFLLTVDTHAELAPEVSLDVVVRPWSTSFLYCGCFLVSELHVVHVECGARWGRLPRLGGPVSLRDALLSAAMFTLQKSVAMTWPRLLKGSKKPGNMHVWWEMHERYEAENKANVDEVKLALKKRKEENASKADKGADVEVETTTPTLTPTPTPLVDKRKLSLEKELTKKRKAVDTKLKDELGVSAIARRC